MARRVRSAAAPPDGQHRDSKCWVSARANRSESLPDREAWSEEVFRMKAHMDVREGESDMDVRPSRHSEHFLGPRPPRSRAPRLKKTKVTGSLLGQTFVCQKTAGMTAKRGGIRNTSSGRAGRSRRCSPHRRRG